MSDGQPSGEMLPGVSIQYGLRVPVPAAGHQQKARREDKDRQYILLYL
jgi:hypothetical protein